MTTKTLKNRRWSFTRLRRGWLTPTERRQATTSAWPGTRQFMNWGTSSRSPSVLGRIHELEMVVLSHADDDHLVLTDSRVEPVVSGAFHLLFTEPATHPDQVAQWMRTTKIRSENRLHVVKVEDLEAPQVSRTARACLLRSRAGRQPRQHHRRLPGRGFAPRPRPEAPNAPRAAGNPPCSAGPAARRAPELLGSTPTGRSSTGRTLMSIWAGTSFSRPWNRPNCTGPSSGAPTSTAGTGLPSANSASRRPFPRRRWRESPNGSFAASSRANVRATMNALRDLAKAHGVDVNTYMEKVANAMP